MTAQPWLDSVIDLLQQEIALSSQIDAQLVLERDALLSRDAQSVAQYSQQKNTLLIDLDSKHSTLMQTISEATGQPQEALSDDQWLQTITDARKEQLSKLWYELHDQLKALKHKNLQNGVSLNRVVSRSRFLLRLLKGDNSPQTYDAKGMESSSRQGSLGKA
ncbi:flagellar protein FlgN [Gynuella sunshinyii]|uniref:Flagellar biosynthesis/type III secretory pathway chaperone n=1 Tax=Gynuella sunshinyii YC6258 TaxID=1445510 RepID=A0A0C5W2A8_9GAMM|nr:flagellar protein FlgN [Gynuella sunshinyii]AJQ96799.1 flagellar biosynthesis/type III secretory pathway chaperone [Gynuella sunshinyii YC6258]